MQIENTKPATRNSQSRSITEKKLQGMKEEPLRKKTEKEDREKVRRLPNRTKHRQETKLPRDESEARKPSPAERM